ncbi:hypothetical protein [Aureimonas glaciei]|uniref:Uncharacterized protein n=1 Tax=Aureimonas glaciei TaxID=1776957 RepID=A0A916Y369_9HYPH|nr:hypothetical protein [Aureimonas glaciei]GGD28504.1 hypothetical protein GCM10011335_34600 [Aureimonas glaciei]
MSTVSWKDVTFTETAGPICRGDVTLDITEDHIARWKEDPDGRYAVMAVSDYVSPVELGKFYPSL